MGSTKTEETVAALEAEVAVLRGLDHAHIVRCDAIEGKGAD